MGEWVKSSPEAQGMDSEKLLIVMDEILHRRCTNTHGVFAVRGGKQVFETYGYPYGPDTLHHVNSVTKSLTSILFGIALKQGLLQDVRQRALDFFPELTIRDEDERKRAITLEHLLTMTSGIQYDDEADLTLCMQTEDWSSCFFNLPMIHEPGTVFCYNSVGSHVLMTIIERAAGMPARAFLERYLFGPLGITHYDWIADPKGVPVGGFGLSLKPADMAKIGLLYLNGGEWEGERIVAEEWIRESTRKRTDNGYGYHWWVFEDENRYDASGYGGQFIHVAPEHDLVVAVTNGGDGELPVSMFVRAIAANAPLPANSEAERLLREKAREAERPKPAQQSLPALAAQVSNRVLRLAANSGGYHSIQINFHTDRENEAELVLGTADGVLRCPVGLDNVYRMSEAVLNLDTPRNMTVGSPDYLTVLQQYFPTHTVGHRGFWRDETTFVLHNELIEVGFRQHIVLHYGNDPVAVEIGIPSYELVYTTEGVWETAEANEGAART